MESPDSGRENNMLLDLYPVMKQEYLSKEEGKEEKAFPLGKNTHHNSWFFYGTG